MIVVAFAAILARETAIESVKGIAVALKPKAAAWAFILIAGIVSRFFFSAVVHVCCYNSLWRHRGCPVAATCVAVHLRAPASAIRGELFRFQRPSSLLRASGLGFGVLGQEPASRTGPARDSKPQSVLFSKFRTGSSDVRTTPIKPKAGHRPDTHHAGSAGLEFKVYGLWNSLKGDCLSAKQLEQAINGVWAYRPQQSQQS